MISRQNLFLQAGWSGILLNCRDAEHVCASLVQSLDLYEVIVP